MARVTSIRIRWLGVVLALTLPVAAAAAELRLAVASNFLATAEALARRYEVETGHRVVLSSASTGKLYAQIRHGAPYDVFLAADMERPRLLQEQGLAEDAFVYAVGRLVLWSPSDRFKGDGPAILTGAGWSHLAIANPRTAPYGAAARDILQGLGLWNSVQGRLVYGENIAQAYHFVASGAAELGFIAASQAPERGYRWPVDIELHRPIHQGAVRLKAAPSGEVAAAFMGWLKSAPVRARIVADGYGSGSGP